MRAALYVIILALMLFAPVNRLDIAKLQPVEAVAVYMESGEVVLRTDLGSTGRGPDAGQALQNLKDTTAAVVYLDTADYLLIAPGAEDAARQLMKNLKKTVQTGVYNGGDVQQEARYLDVHGNAEKPE